MCLAFTRVSGESMLDALGLSNGNVHECTLYTCVLLKVIDVSV